MIRGDLSNRLIHLTRGINFQEAERKFYSIVNDKALKGSSGGIKGGFNCVCFSEAPLSVITHALANPLDNGMRYAPFGVMVSKQWLFSKGGRPVIYQPGEEYNLLHDSQKYRHVRYEPLTGIDFSWEREWRIKIDLLELDPPETTFVIPTRKWEQKYIEDHIQNVAMISGMLDIPWADSFPWHFIALEDLGVEIAEE